MSINFFKVESRWDITDLNRAEEAEEVETRSLHRIPGRSKRSVVLSPERTRN